MRVRTLNNHWTSKHGIMKPKMQFATLDDAIRYMNEHNINKEVYSPYVCRDCGQWHIGHFHKRKK